MQIFRFGSIELVKIRFFLAFNLISFGRFCRIPHFAESRILQNLAFCRISHFAESCISQNLAFCRISHFAESCISQNLAFCRISHFRSSFETSDIVFGFSGLISIDMWIFRKIDRKNARNRKQCISSLVWIIYEELTVFWQWWRHHRENEEGFWGAIFCFFLFLFKGFRSNE